MNGIKETKSQRLPYIEANEDNQKLFLILSA